MSNVQNPQISECWDRACDCFATSRIFERRASRYRRSVDALSYMGIGVPAIFGAMVIAWGKAVLTNHYLMFAIALLGIIQVALSVASIIRGWAAEYAYSNKSAAANYQLSDEFKYLAQSGSAQDLPITQEFQKLVMRDQAQTQSDTERHVTQKEKSWGHRHALRQFQRPCAGCNIVPRDMKSTDCSQCGEF